MTLAFHSTVYTPCLASKEEAQEAKKKAEEMENELRTYVNLVYGPNSWTDILKLQAKIRKDRQEQIYAQQELRRNIINTIGVILGAIVGVVAFGFITYLVVLGLRV